MKNLQKKHELLLADVDAHKVCITFITVLKSALLPVPTDYSMASICS